MDKAYRGKIIGMGIPVVLALIITTIVTIAQQPIIRSVARVFTKSRFARSFFKMPLSRGTVIPYYMYFIILAAIVILVYFIIIASSKKMQDKPMAVVFPIVFYFIAILFGAIYVRVGGDKLVHQKTLATNVDVITYLLSIILSPVMIVFFVFFVMMIVTFMVRSIKLSNQKNRTEGQDS